MAAAPQSCAIGRPAREDLARQFMRREIDWQTLARCWTATPGASAYTPIPRENHLRFCREALAEVSVDPVQSEVTKLLSLLRQHAEANENFSAVLERAREELSVVKNAAAIVANSGATAARLLALFGEAKRIEIIPNGVDRAASCPVKDWTDARHRIVYSGSLFPW